VSAPGPGDGFVAGRETFESVVGFLDGAEAAGMEHAELEAELDTRGRELMRRLLQDHLDLRAGREERIDAVADTEGVLRSRAESGHTRALTSVFGEVTVTRRAYRAPDRANLHPADAALNLPAEKHSHGLRRLAAIEAARGSFDTAVDAIDRATGVRLGKRQAEALATAAAADFDAFYAQRRPPPATGAPHAEDRDLGAGEPDVEALVLSYDGKGVVMRPDALRPATATAAAEATTKLAGRLSKGEKRNRKRMATVGAVYHAACAPRTPGDIMADPDDRQPTPGPVTTDKWLTASVTADAATVIAAVFDEAQRRDPDQRHTWIVLVDGNNHQIERTHAEADARGLDVAIVVDLVHVLEYLWSAAWAFFAEGDPAAEQWVRERALAVLDGNARTVAAGIRRRATTAGLRAGKRRNADTAAAYLIAKAPYLDYPTALNQGWPIATGVIEGACRHLVKDRMDITGARWGLGGAEAVLKLRALHCNNDFDDYWRYHLTQERRRVHQNRYHNGEIPTAA